MADKTAKVARALGKARRKVAPGITGYLLNPADELSSGYVAAEIGPALDGQLPACWTPLNRIGEERLKIRLAESGDLTRDRIVAASAVAIVEDGEAEGVIYDILGKVPSQIRIDREWLFDCALTAQPFSPPTHAATPLVVPFATV